MIAVAIPRCEASVIDDGGDVSGAGEVRAAATRQADRPRRSFPF
jgi:hypothetical protein